MYKIIALLGIYIRFFVLTNPFSGMENEVLLNIGAEVCLHPISFFTVGLFYDAGSEPTLGSFLYLVIYSINIGLLLLWSKVGGSIVAAFIIGVLYISLIIYIKVKKEMNY